MGMFVLIAAYIGASGTTKGIDLLKRLPATESEQLKAQMMGQKMHSDTRYGKFYGKYLEKYISKDPEKLAKQLGIKTDKLEEDIYTAHMEKKITVEEIISMKVVGLGGMLLFGVLCAAMNFDITMLLLAACCYILGSYYPNSLVTNKIKKRKEQMILDLPGFIELTYSVLDAGSPIREALSTIASKTSGPLAEEFRTVEAKTKVSGNWRAEMEKMSQRNGVEPLTDLVSDILIAEDKGTPVADVLKEDAVQMRALKNAKIMEKAKKLTTVMLIPMAFFSFLPMIVLILAPMLVQFMDNF